MGGGIISDPVIQGQWEEQRGRLPWMQIQWLRAWALEADWMEFETDWLCDLEQVTDPLWVSLGIK